MDRASHDSPVEYHDRISDGWAERYKKTSFSKRLTVFSDALADRSLYGETWLDAGCGVGNLSEFLARLGANVVGVDGSQGMIRQASQRTQGRHNLRFECITDLEQWHWEGAALDGVLCSSVVEYLSDPRAFVGRVASWLRPGGTLLLSVPNSRSFVRIGQKCVYAATRLILRNPKPSYLKYSKNEYHEQHLRRQLAECGFLVDRVVFFGAPGLLAIDSRVWSPLMLGLATKV